MRERSEGSPEMGRHFQRLGRVGFFPLWVTREAKLGHFWWPVACQSENEWAGQEEEGIRTREGSPSCLMLKKAYFLAAGGEKHGPDSITR